MQTVVLDTNVLLSDPSVIMSYADAEVLLPDTVLGELDKLKTARVDPDLRFRGREVSRLLFELSERGNLSEGVGLPDGGVLRVVALESNFVFPEELSSKNADDRILAVALQALADRERVELVTNDLNMLLKAQTLGLDVARYTDGVERSFARRFIIRPFQRYKVPLGILAVAVAVFAAIIVLSVYNPLSERGQTALPDEFKSQLLPQQLQVLTLLQTLQLHPEDVDTELQLANLYFDLVQSGHATYAPFAIQHYQRVLNARPNDLDVRVDMAVMFPFVGQTDQAIQETQFVLKKDPNHIQANYNLGIFLLRDKQDYQAAAQQFRKVIELTHNGDSKAQATGKDAATALKQVEADAAKKGRPLASTPPTL